MSEKTDNIMGMLFILVLLFVFFKEKVERIIAVSIFASLVIFGWLGKYNKFFSLLHKIISWPFTACLLLLTYLIPVFPDPILIAYAKSKGLRTKRGTVEIQRNGYKISLFIINETGRYLEISTKSKKERQFSCASCRADISKNTVFSYWPFIDSPVSESKEVVWKKEIAVISEGNTPIYANRQIDKAFLDKISNFDFDMFYLSLNNFFGYIKVAKGDHEKIDKYIENFTQAINKMDG